MGKKSATPGARTEKEALIEVGMRSKEVPTKRGNWKSRARRVNTQKPKKTEAPFHSFRKEKIGKTDPTEENCSTDREKTPRRADRECGTTAGGGRG